MAEDEYGDRLSDTSLIVPDGKEALDYPSNSFKSRSKNDPVKKVAHGKKVVKRKSFKERLVDWLFVDEEDYYDFVYEDLIRPAVIDTISDLSQNVFDTIRETIDIMLFGSVRSARRRGSRYYRTSYDDDYWGRERRSRHRDREDRDDRLYSHRTRSDDVAAKVETRSEAVELVRAMQERCRDYEEATVLNFYDMADMPTKSTDDDYGWDKKHPFEATITRTRDGFIVEPCAPIWLDH